jgi:hypothetical protein
LSFRPLAESLPAIAQWLDDTGKVPKLGAKPEREAELRAAL